MTSLENRLPSLGLMMATPDPNGDEDAVELFEGRHGGCPAMQEPLKWEGAVFAAIIASDKSAKLPSFSVGSRSTWLVWKEENGSVILGVIPVK